MNKHYDPQQLNEIQIKAIMDSYDPKNPPTVDQMIEMIDRITGLPDYYGKRLCWLTDQQADYICDYGSTFEDSPDYEEIL